MKKTAIMIAKEQAGVSEDAKRNVSADFLSIRKAARRILSALDEKFESIGDEEDDYSDMIGVVFEIEDSAKDIIDLLKRIGKIVD